MAGIELLPMPGVGKGLNFGASLNADGSYTFGIWSPSAEGMRLHFYLPDETKLGTLELTDREGGVWYARVGGLKPGFLYAIEALGQEDHSRGLYFREGRFLVDPYAVELNKPFKYSDDLYFNHNEEFIPKAVLQGEDDFDWQGDKRVFNYRRQSVVYEAHVRGMTMLHPDVPQNLRGTYLGLCCPEIIAHFKRMGITIVQLMPIAASMTEPGVAARGLTNYWGYNPGCFMAPDPRYASDPKNAVNEFKTMVRTLHQNGIGVILDVVFNHTAEGGVDGPVLSFKGLDARNYFAYARNESGLTDFNQPLNCSGCGNAFNCDSTIGLMTVHRSMLYWAEQMHVDGFRFDLAVTLGRESHEGGRHFAFDMNSAFFKLCDCSKSLGPLLMIAEPWDLGELGYNLGNFPLHWSEQNDHFRDGMRRFWRGEPGMLGEIATRLMGSRDFFHKGERAMTASLNYVTYHDGFTLEDLVSYAFKHNDVNGEDNRDGSSENFSTNCGIEGPTDDPEIIHRREQLKRNLMACTIIAQGMPHILGGDELGRTQQGNNNAYCQDNDISYYNWNISKHQDEFISFIGRLTRIRLNSKVLQELALDDDNFYKKEDKTLVRWRRPDGHLMGDHDWNDPAVKALLLYIGERDINGERWCIIINQGLSEVMFRLPEIGRLRRWQVLIDTSESDGVPRRFNEASATEGVIAPTSVKVLCSAPNLEHQATIIDTDLYGPERRHSNRSFKGHSGW